MKKLFAFIAVFITVVIIGYLQPIFFPVAKTKIVSEYEGRPTSHTALAYEELETQGYAQYIGNDTQEFIDMFGEPNQKIETAYKFELWIFDIEDKGYLEINVYQNKISAIKVFNQTEETTPFYQEMKLSDVSQFSTIFSNFVFTYEEQQYDIELTEEDMNYRPLFAFDNGTFAILFFNQGNNELSGITYLDKETLLTLMPYQLVEGEALPTLPQKSFTSFNSIQSTQGIRVINLLREQENKTLYSSNKKSQKSIQTIVDSLITTPSDFLKDDRLMLWYQVQEQGTVSPTFTLSNTEFQELVAANNLPVKKVTGMYTTPVYDLSFTILNWFSDSLYYSRFNHDKKETISVAFSKESVLVLVEEEQKETSQTEESE